jgi:vacuolar-type H+-ATPase subunit E/Vma4
MEAAEAIDASIEALRAQTAEEIENMISADAGVRAELERVRNDARNVAETEIDKAEEKEKQRIESAFEEVQQKTGAVQSKAEQAAVETARLKAEAVQQAEAKMAALEAEREALRRELEREESRGGVKWSDDSIDEAAEKMESAKAAVLGGAGGGALATPLILSQGGGVVSIGIAAVSCAVFGVTYRYAVRKDLGNNELKCGLVVAYGLARGLSAADVYLRAASLNGDAAGFETYAQAALLAGQGVLMYAFAALALEQGFSQGFLKPFGDASAASKD